MKLIIEIPDGYDYLSDIKNGSIASANILNAVKNGKPYVSDEVYHQGYEDGYEVCAINEAEAREWDDIND